ncbi:MAG: hypothetical protein ACJ79O_14455 [Myxococcales bacterium]
MVDGADPGIAGRAVDKGTLLESGVGGPRGGLVPPTWEPGVVSTLFEPLGVADVFGSSQTSASQVRYVVVRSGASELVDFAATENAEQFGLRRPFK